MSSREACGWFDLSRKESCRRAAVRGSDYCPDHEGTTRDTHPELSRYAHGVVGISPGAMLLKHGYHGVSRKRGHDL